MHAARWHWPVSLGYRAQSAGPSRRPLGWGWGRPRGVAAHRHHRKAGFSRLRTNSLPDGPRRIGLNSSKMPGPLKFSRNWVANPDARDLVFSPDRPAHHAKAVSRRSMSLRIPIVQSGARRFSLPVSRTDEPFSAPTDAHTAKLHEMLHAPSPCACGPRAQFAGVGRGPSSPGVSPCQIRPHH